MNNFMKVEVVLRETIKPSSPTPPHLRIFQLSLFDQIAPPFYTPILLFYPPIYGNHEDNNEKIIKEGYAASTSSRCCDIIKRSLAETLTRFYPLAGRLKDDKSVDCNDDGIDYVEARVHGGLLSQVIQQHDVNVMKQLFPCEPYGEPPESGYGFGSGFNSKVLLAVQVNVFEYCGGMAIGVCISHRMADASSLISFINEWAATARGATEQNMGPRFDLSSLFPPTDLVGFDPYKTLKRDDEIVSKNFVFEASKIAELKRIIIIGTSSTDDVELVNPTRVEAVTAFIWKCFMDMNEGKKEEASGSAGAGVRVLYMALHAVNMRARMVPPLPTNVFGNMWSTAVAVSIVNNDNADDQGMQLDDEQYPKLVGEVKNSIKRIDGDHVRELQTPGAFLKSLQQTMNVGVSNDGQRTMMLRFTSWFRFPIYESDFGWGKPIWVSMTTLPVRNLVWLIDTSSGDGGIEALLCLTKEDMVEFERNIRF